MSMSIKLIIIGLNNRVLFAEASKEVVNALLKLLNIPIGIFAGLHTHEVAYHQVAECGIWNLHYNMRKFDNHYNLLPHPKKDFTDMKLVASLDDFKCLSLRTNVDMNFNPFFMLCPRYYHCGILVEKEKKQKKGENQQGKNKVEYQKKEKQPQCSSLCPYCRSQKNVYIRNNHISMGDIAKEEGMYLLMDNLKILSPNEFGSDYIMKIPTVRGLSREETDSLIGVIVPLGVKELLDLLKKSFNIENVLTSFYNEFLEVEKMEELKKRNDKSECSSKLSI